MMKRGSQVAIVAVARKLLTIAYQVWKQETFFDGVLVGKKKCDVRRGSAMDGAVDLAKVA